MTSLRACSGSVRAVVGSGVACRAGRSASKKASRGSCVRRIVRCQAQQSGLPTGKILVAGATGGVGSRTIKQLVEQNANIRALVREGSNSSGLDSSVEIVIGDVYDYSSVLQATQDCEYLICATGSRPSLDPLGPFNVDFQGTLNLIEAAKANNVKHFVLVTSLGTDNILNPLNLFFGILFWKKQAELQLQRSGLTYTIVRPGGLKDTLESGEKRGAIQMQKANAIETGRILREQVAEVCLAALSLESAKNKVCEIVASSEKVIEGKTSMATFDELFASL